MVIVTRFEAPALPDSHLLCTERICALQIALHPAQISQSRLIYSVVSRCSASVSEKTVLYKASCAAIILLKRMVGNRLIATQVRASGNGASATARSYGTTSYRKLTISRGNAYDRCAEQSKEHVSSQVNPDVFLCHKTISYGYCSKCRGGWEAPRSGFRRVQKNSVYFWLCKKRKPQILSGVFMANHANLDKNAPHLASGCISGQAGAILRIRCNQTASTTVLFILEFTFVSYW